MVQTIAYIFRMVTIYKQLIVKCCYVQLCTDKTCYRFQFNDTWLQFNGLKECCADKYQVDISMISFCCLVPLFYWTNLVSLSKCSKYWIRSMSHHLSSSCVLYFYFQETTGFVVILFVSSLKIFSNPCACQRHLLLTCDMFNSDLMLLFRRAKCVCISYNFFLLHELFKHLCHHSP